MNPLNQISRILLAFRPTLSAQAITEEAQHLLQRDTSLREKEMDKKECKVKV